MVSGELPRACRARPATWAALSVLLLLGCSGERHDPAAVSDPVVYGEEIAAWHADRVRSLKSETGYLNLAGLYWLAEGEYRLGTAAAADLPLPPGTAAPIVGTLLVAAGSVRFRAAPGVDVRQNGGPLTGGALMDDSTDQADLLTHRRLGWFVIRRGERLGLRVRDFDHPALDVFPGIERFPVEPRWRVAAELQRYDRPRQLRVDTVVDGLAFEPVSPGVLRFELAGSAFELEVYGAEGDDGLLVLFADATSGQSTYGAGRFLYAPWVDAQDRTVLDFNQAYNPPCAFNDFATCPVAPLKNRLPIAVEAGEKYSAELHVAGR